MKEVLLTWTPSASAGVEGQKVSIQDAKTMEVYGQASLSPSAGRYAAAVPEGSSVHGVITTVRGNQQVTDVSSIVDVGFGELLGVTEIVLSVSPEPSPKR